MFYRKQNECCFEGKVGCVPEMIDDVLYFTLLVPKNNGDNKFPTRIPLCAFKAQAQILKLKLSEGDLVYVESVYSPVTEKEFLKTRFNITRLFQITSKKVLLAHSQD